MGKGRKPQMVSYQAGNWGTLRHFLCGQLGNISKSYSTEGVQLRYLSLNLIAAPEFINFLALATALQSLPLLEPKKQQWSKQPGAVEVDTQGYRRVYQCLLLV